MGPFETLEEFCQSEHQMQVCENKEFLMKKFRLTSL
jgi:hypothetical protein